VSNLQNRIVLYQKLQNSLQVAGNENFSEEIRVFHEEIGPLLLAHMGQKIKTTKALLRMAQVVERYDFMRQVAEFFPIPPGKSMGQGIIDSMTLVDVPPAVTAYANLGDAYRANDAAAFKKALIEYGNWLATKVPNDVTKAQNEFVFNYYEPFYKSMVVYLA